MSVSLGIFKGKQFDSFASQFITAIPISFQTVWNSEWSKAISECNIRIFVNNNDFPINDIPAVLAELDTIYHWSHDNNGKDTPYIQNRIKELKEYLSQFYQAHKDEDYWFSLG